MLIAEPPEHLGREQAAFHLGFLKAENVGSFFAQEFLDDADARANAVDIPRCDAGASHAVGSIGARRRSQCDCGLVPPAAFAAEKRAGQIKPPSPGRWNGGSRSEFVTPLHEGAWPYPGGPQGATQIREPGWNRKKVE